MDQIKACASAGNFNAYVDTIKKVLAIWPMGGSRTAAPLEISPQSGLIGYPTFSNRQLDFRTYYNPGLLFGSAGADHQQPQARVRPLDPP